MKLSHIEALHRINFIVYTSEIQEIGKMAIIRLLLIRAGLEKSTIKFADERTCLDCGQIGHMGACMTERQPI